MANKKNVDVGVNVGEMKGNVGGSVEEEGIVESEISDGKRVKRKRMKPVIGGQLLRTMDAGGGVWAMVFSYGWGFDCSWDGKWEDQDLE